MAKLGWLITVAIGFGFTAQADVPASIELRLGLTQSYMFQVESSGEETLKLSVDRKELDAIEGGAKVAVTLTPAEVILKPGQAATVEFKVSVPTDSPSFTSAKVAVFSQGRGGRMNLGETSLTVKPFYLVELHGGSPETWSAPKASNFVAHKDGLTVRFVNLDKSKSHTIHASGAIPHQSGSLPPAGEEGPAGSYEAVIKPSTNPSKAGVYCHDHEGFGNNRTLNFNVTAK